MDIQTLVADVEQWTLAEIHELKAWLDAHVLHRAALAEVAVAPEPVVDAPATEPTVDAPPAEPAAV